MNPTTPVFPLSDSELLITHAGLTNALQRCREIVMTPDDTYIGVLVGPTGVGKSTVAQELVAQINAEHALEMTSNPSLLPAAYATQRLLSDKQFNWLATINTWLDALGYVGPRFRDLELARKKLAELLASKKTQVFVVDEAGHIVSNIDPDNKLALEAQADVLKSISDETKTKFLLVSAYTVIPLLRSNGQLSRRRQLVHFERYKFHSDGKEQFRKILAVLDEQLAGFFKFPLTDQHDIIMAGCAGLVGMLRPWFLRAWTNATQRGLTKISLDSLTATKTEIKDLAAIVEEAKAGESYLETLDADIEYYTRLLQQDSDGPSRQGPPPAPTTPKRSKTKRTRRPKRPPAFRSEHRKAA